MIPTKTYPLSAVMGEEVTDKARIAELEAQLKHAEGHAAELETELTMRREQAEGLQNQWVKDTQKIVWLEAAVKMLREAMDRYSEDEMLLIERCAKVCEVMGFKHSECPEMSEYCADAIRALKEEK